MSEATFAMNWLNQYNATWTSQSRNAGESVPVSGGDIRLNGWAENGALLKPGRLRVQITPDLFERAEFKQELKLREGYALVTAAATKEWTPAL
jgi:hypothetical protein